MDKHRLASAVAALFYVGIGAWVVFIVVFSSTDERSDLSSLDPVFDGIVIGVYVAGAALLIRYARARRTWRMLLVPIAFFPAFMLAMIIVLFALGGTI